jgi:hypothetical protein
MHKRELVKSLRGIKALAPVVNGVGHQAIQLRLLCYFKMASKNSRINSVINSNN